MRTRKPRPGKSSPAFPSLPHPTPPASRPLPPKSSVGMSRFASVLRVMDMSNPLNTQRHVPAPALCLAALALLGLSDLCLAQMIPVEDRRELWVVAVSNGEQDNMTIVPSGPFAPLVDGWAHAYIETGPPEDGHYCEADATQS